MKMRRDRGAGEGQACSDAPARTRPTEERDARGSTCPGGQKRRQETTENAAVRPKGPAGPSSLPIPPRSARASPVGLSEPAAPSGQPAPPQRPESQGTGPSCPAGHHGPRWGTSGVRWTVSVPKPLGAMGSPATGFVLPLDSIPFKPRAAMPARWSLQPQPGAVSDRGCLRLRRTGGPESFTRSPSPPLLGRIRKALEFLENRVLSLILKAHLPQ